MIELYSLDDSVRGLIADVIGRPCALAAALLSLGACAHVGEHWIATWAASPQEADPPLQISGQTVRQVMRISMGGPRFRVRLSNLYGTKAIEVGAAHLALHGDGAAIVPGSDRTLSFGGAPSVSIPPGALVVSDPVALAVPSLGDLAVSLYLPGTVSATTEHSSAIQTTYVSSAGDFSGAETLIGPSTTQSWYFIAGIEVDGPANAHAVVALGDSVTDGQKSTRDASHRWPNFLAARLQGASRAVVNAGIAGNRILDDLVGANALARLDRDLAQPGAKYVIVLEGINDIGFHEAGDEVTADQIIAGHRQIILRARGLGLKVFGATLIPFEGTTFSGFYTEAGEKKRQIINEWIRSSGAYDGVIDFDRAARDPAHPTRLLPAFDSGDHCHPNDAGYKAMANAIDLALFD